METLGIIVASVALVVAAIACYYTWTSFRIQKASSKFEGLLFILRNIHREVRIESSDPNQEAHAVRTHLIAGFEARGPGERYNVSVAAWGNVEARFLPDMLPKWNAEGEILAFEMYLKKGALDHSDGVYVGIMWEVPTIVRNRFKPCGYRVRLKHGKHSAEEDYIETWSSWKNKWVKLKKISTDDERGALATGVQFQSRGYGEQLGVEFYSRPWGSVEIRRGFNE